MSVRKWGVEQLVNVNVTGFQNVPVIVGLPDGGYVVSWTDYDPPGGDGSLSRVKFQRFDAAGIRIGWRGHRQFRPFGRSINVGGHYGHGLTDLPLSGPTPLNDRVPALQYQRRCARSGRRAAACFAWQSIRAGPGRRSAAALPSPSRTTVLGTQDIQAPAVPHQWQHQRRRQSTSRILPTLKFGSDNRRTGRRQVRRRVGKRYHGENPSPRFRRRRRSRSLPPSNVSDVVDTEVGRNKRHGARQWRLRRRMEQIPIRSSPTLSVSVRARIVTVRRRASSAPNSPSTP